MTKRIRWTEEEKCILAEKFSTLRATLSKEEYSDLDVFRATQDHHLSSDRRRTIKNLKKDVPWLEKLLKPKQSEHLTKQTVASQGGSLKEATVSQLLGELILRTIDEYGPTIIELVKKTKPKKNAPSANQKKRIHILVIGTTFNQEEDLKLKFQSEPIDFLFFRDGMKFGSIPASITHVVTTWRISHNWASSYIRTRSKAEIHFSRDNDKQTEAIIQGILSEGQKV